MGGAPSISALFQEGRSPPAQIQIEESQLSPGQTKREVGPAGEFRMFQNAIVSSAEDRHLGWPSRAGPAFLDPDQSRFGCDNEDGRVPEAVPPV
jgi:hypothetical protein